MECAKEIWCRRKNAENFAKHVHKCAKEIWCRRKNAENFAKHVHKCKHKISIFPPTLDFLSTLIYMLCKNYQHFSAYTRFS